MENKNVGPMIVILMIVAAMLYGLVQLQTEKQSPLGAAITDQIKRKINQ